MPCHRLAPREKGVGTEVGLARVVDAKRVETLPRRHKVFRVLLEIGEYSLKRAHTTLSGSQKLLQEAQMQRPIPLHGVDETV